MTPLPCPFCGVVPEVGRAEVACLNSDCPASQVIVRDRDAVLRWNTRADPVRAALAVPGVADALAWAMRTYTLTDEYGAMRADATGAMNDALRALADAARGSK